MFITIEGNDNVGKSSQAIKLRDYLLTNGVDVFLTAQPSRSHFGVAVKDLVTSHKLCPQAAALLFAAEMAEHTRSHILPAIKAGKVVICDRYADSLRAYQGRADGVSKAHIAACIDIATCRLQPDMTIVIDLGYNECLKRNKHRVKKYSDNLDKYSPVRHQAIRDEYSRLTKLSPSRMVIVNGAQTESALHKQIAEIVKPFINGEKGK